MTTTTPPSGSGQSTPVRCAAGLHTLTSGAARIGDTAPGGLDDRRLTLPLRARVDFVFQAYDLVPTPTVAESITLPLDLAGGGGDPEGRHRHDARPGPRHGPRPRSDDGGGPRPARVPGASVSGPPGGLTGRTGAAGAE